MSRLRNILPLLIAALTSAMAQAQQPDALGRLFFAPERRDAMERQRSQNILQVQALQGTMMSLDGVVYRSSGKSTVWINRHPQNENDSNRTGVTADLSPGNPGRAVIKPGEDIPTPLKVGEAVNRATGERNTRLGGGIAAPAEPSRRAR